VTGVFDRVVVEFDGSGRAIRAVVYDFKTDRETGDSGRARAVARHEGQIALYRRVVAVMTGLPVAAVRAELVFTETGRRVTVLAGT
jgi:ATP-dependent exoDNAse (exonuclease V) beta subunit